MGRKKKVVKDEKKVSKKVSTECADKKKSDKQKVINKVKITKKVKELKVSGDVDKVLAKDIVTECVDEVKVEVKSRRGRPKKIQVNKLSTECVNELSINAKTFKFLGYCSNPICNGFLSDGDIIDIKKNVVKCIRCGVVQKVSDLLLEKKTDKEMFDNSRNVIDIDYDTEDYSNSLPEDFSDLASNYKDDWEDS